MLFGGRQYHQYRQSQKHLHNSDKAPRIVWQMHGHNVFGGAKRREPATEEGEWPLPPGWERMQSQTKPGTFYYYNQSTKQTRLTRPVDSSHRRFLRQASSRRFIRQASKGLATRVRRSLYSGTNVQLPSGAGEEKASEIELPSIKPASSDDDVKASRRRNTMMLLKKKNATKARGSSPSARNHRSGTTEDVNFDDLYKMKKDDVADGHVSLPQTGA